MDIESMKDTIVDEAPHLSRDQYIEILTMIKSHTNAISTHNDGTRVNLDKLPQEAVTSIYTYVAAKLGLNQT